MISISGIKYQSDLEKLPFFDKVTAGELIGKFGKNLDSKMARLVRIGYLKTLKKGVYVTSSFVDRQDTGAYSEYVANIIRSPSYISSEYVLAVRGIIPESVFSITSITLKSTRSYKNFLGNFIYKNVKPNLFYGFIEKDWGDNAVYIATTAKAIFDYFYLRGLGNIG